MAKATILLVTRDEDLKSLVRKLLEPDGYELIFAEDGQSAWNLVARRSVQFDLFILSTADRFTPDFLSWLGRSALGSRVPVVLFTAQGATNGPETIPSSWGVSTVGVNVSYLRDDLLPTVRQELERAGHAAPEGDERLRGIVMPPPAPEPEKPVLREAQGLFPPEEAPTPPPSFSPAPAPAALPPAAPPPPAPPAPAFGAVPQAAVPPAPAQPAAIPTEDVRFTAYFPKEVTVETWYTLLAYAHVDAVLARVQADAARFKDEMGGVPKEARSTAPAQLARGTEITMLPTCDGVIFNPERITFKWVEDMQRADFRLRATRELAGLAGNLSITVLVGPVIVGTIRGGLVFNESSTTATFAAPVQATTSMYRSEQIFVSYSHADEDIVIACQNTYAALGWGVFRDRDTLRPGEDWDTRLLELIDQADLFQLFWSENSAKSEFCKKEWQHALDLEARKVKGADFIRPVYWKQPSVTPPDELAKIHFTYSPLGAPPQPGQPGH